MNPEQMQPQQDMTPDEAAAALALATRLSEGLMPKAPQSPENAPGQEQTQETSDTPSTQEPTQQEPNKLEEQLDTLTKDLAEFKGNIEGVINSKFDALTKTITDALK